MPAPAGARARPRACIECPSMNLRATFGEAPTLVAAAVLCALVANALARSERKLAARRDYPNALKVPEKKTETVFAQAPRSRRPPATRSRRRPTLEARPPRRRRGAPKATPAPPPRPNHPSKKSALARAAKSTGAAPAPPDGRGAKDSSLSRRFPPHPDKPYVEISGDDAAWLVARGVLVLDARRTKDYEQGHVAGARNISPLGGRRGREDHGARDEGRDGAVPVVLYCSGGDCEDSHMLARALRRRLQQPPRLPGRLARLGQARRKERDRAGAGRA